jgi:ribosomal protein S27E
LKIYEVDFVVKEKIEIPDGAELPDDFDRENARALIDHRIHLGGISFYDVLEEAESSIEDAFTDEETKEKPDFEITSIKEIPLIDVLNWPGEGSECDCPMCRAERMADEDIMKVECPKCGDITRIADGGWDWIKCHKCETQIERSSLIEAGLSLYKVLNLNIDTDL